KERAYAKINLCLNVIRRRENGYHDLKMVMVPVDFYDVLDVVPSDKTSLTINRSFLPVNEKNTVIKAIRILQERYQINQEYKCTLMKHIPTQAGLAGGSADAAAVIRAIDYMEGLNLTREELIEIGKEVGADVPFCIFNQPSIVEGIGEVLTPFQVDCAFELLLVKPYRGVSTAKAFEGINFDTIVHPDCEAMRTALANNDYGGVLNNLGNSLEEVSIQLVREIGEVKKELENLGFDGVLMSGSGSTVFGITRNKELLEEATSILRKKRYFVRKTQILKW
ncbi:MAG: 4-(cytidine 5'-diphospho)-2-C-methyl-D-erythritol kinase, partial [Solobacterium sp.]|nr:4-(cytidine 5'-diphospho)-2-C-methyl-D-erythritol kinase [Solobacterium sp.]